MPGSNPSAWRRRSGSLNARGSRLIWDGGFPRLPLGRPHPAASLRSLRAALENASRFLSSAPLRVRIPPLAHKKSLPIGYAFERLVSLAGTEGFRVRLAGGRAPLRRFAPCVLRWKTLRVSSAPHPCGFESLRMPTRKASRSAMRSRGWFLWLGRRDSNPQQPAPKTGVLPLNYVPMCGVAKSNSSSLPNLRGHRKRHRAGVPRASGRRWQ